MISSRHSRPLLLRIDRWRDRLEELLSGLSREISPEECHEIRESLGRLATWLRLAGFPSHRERVQTLRRDFGPVRDLDVVRESLDGPDAEILARERQRRSKRLRSKLAGNPSQTLLRDLRELPAANYEAIEEEARYLARRVGKAGAAFAGKPTRSHAHRLRRRLREYRFAREWLRLSTSSLKPLIRRLGRLNDDTLLQAVLRDLGAECDDSESRAEHELKACRTKWKTLRGEIRDWSRLRERSGRTD